MESPARPGDMTSAAPSPANSTRSNWRRRWFPLRWHDKQQKLWSCRKRFVAVPAGRRSGKTELAKRKLVSCLPVLKPWPDPRYFYAAPTEGQGKRLAWQDLIDLTPPNWIYGEPHYSELTIVTKFGSSISIIGLDKPQRAEGIPWDGGVIDESCDVKPRAIDLSIGPALSDRMGWLWRIGVPKRWGIGASEFRMFCERAAKGTDPDEACFTWPSSDIQPPEVLRYYQEHMDAVDYAEQFDASWQRASGQVFHSYDPEYNDRSCEFRPDLPLVVGCDFNVNPMAWVLGHQYDFGIEWFDELFIRDTNTPAALDCLWSRYGQHCKAGIHFFGDASGRSRKSSASKSDYLHIANDERFRRKGATVHFPRSNPSVADRFAACNAMFCNSVGTRRMFVDPRCVHLKVDLDQRGYREGSNESDDKGDVGHPSDAMGYPVFILYPLDIEKHGSNRVVIKRPEGSNGNGRKARGNGNNGSRRAVRRRPYARR